MDHLTVCVIVPVHNMENYLETCIESLIRQTYTNLSIILVNDASTDDSLTILKNYERRYPKKITVIDLKENLMLGGARNLGIRLSKSDYVGFVDADDFVHPLMYQMLMKEAETHNLEVVYCRHERVDEGSSLSNTSIALQSDYENGKIYRAITAEERMKLIALRDYGSVWAGIYQRNLIVDNNLFFPEHLAYEDNYWVYSLLLLLKSVAIIPQRYYYYRQRSDSLSHKKNSLLHYDRIEISKRFLNYVKENNLLKQYHAIIEYIFIQVYMFNSFFIFIDYFDKPQEKKLKQIKRIFMEEFPRWQKNSFYKNYFSITKKIKLNLIMILPPSFCIRIWLLKKFILS